MQIYITLTPVWYFFLNAPLKNIDIAITNLDHADFSYNDLTTADLT